jgi:hypothetical protein
MRENSLLLNNNILASLSHSPDHSTSNNNENNSGFIGDISSLLSSSNNHDTSANPSNNNNNNANSLMMMSPLSSSSSSAANTNSNSMNSLNIGNGSNTFALQHILMMINQFKTSNSNESNNLIDSNTLIEATTTTNNNNNNSVTFQQISNNIMSTNNLKCYQHSNEMCQNYCNLCQKTLCAECSMSAQHRQHAKTSMHEIVTDAKLTIDNLVSESTQIVDVFKDSLKQSVQMIARIQAKTDLVSNEINKTHVQHLKALDQRKKLLLENLDIIQSTKVKSLQKQINEIKKKFNHIDEIIHEVNSKLKINNNNNNNNYKCQSIHFDRVDS